MRLLFLTQWFDPEPGHFRGLPLARALQDRGHDVTVITGYPNYPGGKIYSGYRQRPFFSEVMDGVTVHRVPLFPSHGSSAIGRVLNYTSFTLSLSTLGLVRAPKTDICYVYHPPPTIGFAAMLHKALRRTRFVYHIADMWPESVIESGMLRRGRASKVIAGAINAWCRLVYAQADAITVLSPGFKRMLVQRGVPAEKVRVVYNWSDDSALAPMERDETLAVGLGMADRFNVVYAGNFGPLQNLQTLIDAANRLRDLPNIQIVLAGSGQMEESLKQHATRTGAENVRFLPRRPQTEMAAVNALADVLYISLRDKRFLRATIPGKTQVVLASGVPALVAARGDAADLVQSSGGGVACASEDPEEIAASVRTLYAMSADERKAMGERGRQFYLTHLSLSAGTQSMETIFHSILNEHSRSRISGRIGPDIPDGRSGELS
jgi:glycosyltransferase involved in cell wall biosynthesis